MANRPETIEDDINQGIDKHKFYGQVDFGVSQSLFWIALIASFIPIVANLFQDSFSPRAISLFALVPGIVVLIQKTFKFDERADWHWEYFRRLNSLRRKIKFTTNADLNVLTDTLNVLDKEMDDSFPNTNVSEIVSTQKYQRFQQTLDQNI